MVLSNTFADQAAAETKVYIVTWKTESSDEGVECFAQKPTEKQLKAYFKELMPDEFYQGDCTINWEVHEMTPKTLPKAAKAKRAPKV